MIAYDCDNKTCGRPTSDIRDIWHSRPCLIARIERFEKEIAASKKLGLLICDIAKGAMDKWGSAVDRIAALENKEK